MDFDTYWKGLIEQIYRQGYKPKGAEEDLYRLTCIYGETMVDGIEAYFGRRYGEFDADMEVLVRYGFIDIASDFQNPKDAMFGDLHLVKEVVTPVVTRLLDDREEDKPILEELRRIYLRLIEALPNLIDARDRIGAENRFFTDEN